MFTKSIRWRFLLWLAFLLVCILGGFGATAYQLHRTNRFNQIDEDLQRRLVAVTGDVRGRPPFGERGDRRPFGERGAPGRRGERPPFGGPDEPPPFGPGSGRFPWRPPSSGVEMPPGFPDFRPRPREIRLSAQTLSQFDDTEPNACYFAIWSREGTLLKSSTNAPLALAVPTRIGSDTQSHTRMREPVRETFHFTEMGECVLVGRSIIADLSAMGRFALWLFGAGGAVLAFGLGGGWWLAARALQPVQDITLAASHISAGNLSKRINLADTHNELGHLAKVLNSTFARLEGAFAQQKQFTADASHELRTPLAVIISEAQTALSRQRSAAEYRETVETCLDTAQQMRRLTQSLLDLARLDAGQEHIQRVEVDLADKARACISLIRPLADTAGVEIKCDLAPAPAVGDVDCLGQVITNLLTNAIHYNKDGGSIRVSTRTEEKAAIVMIADTGIGISTEDLPHIFERFYRADKSRARSNGRSGLGLAICKTIVDAHGGTIEVSSEVGVGTAFTVRLPSARF